jgi:tRNA G46 methylase TrmB
MVEVMKNILQPGGEFLLTTDVGEYADHCRKVFAEGKGWQETGFSPWHQYRIRTPYEEKGLKNGHSISELAYRVLP